MKKPLANPFNEIIQKKELEKNVKDQEIKKMLQEIKQHHQNIAQLGHDGRVDEVVMLTLLSSFLDTTIKAAQAIVMAKKERELNMIEKELKSMLESSTNYEKFVKQADELNKFSTLMANKNILQRSLKNDDLTQPQRELKEQKLKKVELELKEYGELLELKNEEGKLLTDKELEKEIFKSEKNVFGEYEAQQLQDFRDVSPNVEKVLIQAGQKESLKEGEIPLSAVQMLQKALVADKTEKIYKETTKTQETEKSFNPTQG